MSRVGGTSENMRPLQDNSEVLLLLLHARMHAMHAHV
jgi:hypothetical protein